MPCMSGAKILNSLLLGGFCGHTKINLDPSGTKKIRFFNFHPHTHVYVHASSSEYELVLRRIMEDLT